MPRVAVLLPAAFGDAGELLADAIALETAGAYAELVEGSDPAALLVLGAVAAVTHTVKIGCLAGAELSPDALAALDRISRGRGVAVPPDDRRETWTRIEVPPDRAAWQAALAEHEAAGTSVVVVPWDPRLVDLLRNPEADGDRSDLMMSTG